MLLVDVKKNMILLVCVFVSSQKESSDACFCDDFDISTMMDLPFMWPKHCQSMHHLITAQKVLRILEV